MIKQFTKFGLVGVINTVIDFSVLNFLIFIFGLSAGSYNYIVFKMISFMVAVTNSYFMNKYFVFNSKQEKPKYKEFITFLNVSAVGIVINFLIAFLFFWISSRLYNSSGSTLAVANVGAILGSLSVFVWNFFGYKFFVFSSKT